jgi:hypothetical protein
MLITFPETAGRELEEIAPGHVAMAQPVAFSDIP